MFLLIDIGDDDTGDGVWDEFVSDNDKDDAVEVDESCVDFVVGEHVAVDVVDDVVDNDRSSDAVDIVKESFFIFDDESLRGFCCCGDLGGWSIDVDWGIFLFINCLACNYKITF